MPKHFNISFERSGGFTGIPVKCSIDSSILPAEEFKEFSEMIDKIDFKNLSGNKNSSAGYPDQTVYKLDINIEGDKHSFDFREQSISEEIRTLIRGLERIARNHNKPK